MNQQKYMAVGLNPSTPLNIQTTSEKDHSRVLTTRQKVPEFGVDPQTMQKTYKLRTFL